MTSRYLITLFATASGLSVANVYFAQPLLDALALDFGISHAAVGGVVTATQLGCALALLLLVPLGDLLNRRTLMLTQLGALVAALLLVASSHSSTLLLFGMTAVGMLGTAMTQGLIAYAASAAAPEERGRVVGAAGSGVFIGLLLARVFSGAVSDIAGWRGVYAGAALLMLALAMPLWRGLPQLRAPRAGISYPRLIVSMFALLREERTLRVRGTLALLMFAAFNIFWSALVLPLSAPPHSYSHTAMGAFGLVGAVSAFAASWAGKLADRGFGQRTTTQALLLLVFAWLPLSLLDWSIWPLLAGVVLLDLAGQALHVTNQSMIFRTRPEAHSRLVGAYMLFYASGSGLGAIGATSSFAAFGWAGVCVLGAAVSLAALLYWLSTGRTS